MRETPTAAPLLRPVYPHGNGGGGASALTPPAPRGVLGVPFLADLWQLPARLAPQRAWKAGQNITAYDEANAMLVLVPEEEEKEEEREGAPAAAPPPVAEPLAVGPAAGPEPEDGAVSAPPAPAHAPTAVKASARERARATGARRATKPAAAAHAPPPAVVHLTPSSESGGYGGEHGVFAGGYGGVGGGTDGGAWMSLTDLLSDLSGGVDGRSLFGG